MTKKKDPRDFKPNGRPTKYKPEYCQRMVEYFNVDPYREITRVNEKTGKEYTQRTANSLPTLVGFAVSIGVSRMTIQNWGKKHPEFFYAVTRAKASAEHMLVTNALLGLYNPQFSVFVAKNYTDMRDVKELNIHDNEPPPRTTKEVIDGIAALDEEIKRLEAQL